MNRAAKEDLLKAKLKEVCELIFELDFSNVEPQHFSHDGIRDSFFWYTQRVEGFNIEQLSKQIDYYKK